MAHLCRPYVNEYPGGVARAIAERTGADGAVVGVFGHAGVLITAIFAVSWPAAWLFALRCGVVFASVLN